MTGLTALWLPILLSAVGVFVLSSLIHMLTHWHESDYPLVPNQDKVMDTMRSLNIPPGDYFIPRPASRAEMRSPQFDEKMKKGPVVVMTVLPTGQVSFGKRLVLWFVYSVIVGIFAAYVAEAALPPGATFKQVLRFAGVTAFIGYGLALWQMSIWYGRAWLTTIKATVDSLVYAVLTAAILTWMWPH
jgi:hypothetical protein